MDMPLKLVIFDVDGTLVDSQAHILGAMEQAFGTLGLAVPPRAEVLSIVGLSLPEAFAALVPGQPPEVRARLVTAYKTGFAHHREDSAQTNAAPLYPGAEAAVRGLDREGYLLSAATGKSRRGLDRFLEAHDFGMFFGTQTADDAPSKPHPQMVLNCLAANGVAAEDAVMIGDTEYDMAMGRAAGVRTIGVSWGYHGIDRVRRGGAMAVVERFEDLGDLVADMLGAA